MIVLRVGFTDGVLFCMARQSRENSQIVELLSSFQNKLQSSFELCFEVCFEVSDETSKLL